MKLLRPLVISLFLAACTRGGSTAPAPMPTPARADTAARATPAPVPVAPAPLAPGEPPRNWHLLDAAADGVPGISLERAMRELLAGKQPRRTVVVAILDSGLDTAHADLKDNLWRNPKDTPGNGRDDDNNGYPDDVRGWSFLGGRDGQEVQYETLEVTRLYVRCLKADTIAAAADRGRCDAIRQDFAKQKDEAERLSQQVQQIGVLLDRAVNILQRGTGSDSLTVERVTAFQPGNAE